MAEEKINGKVGYCFRHFSEKSGKEKGDIKRRAKFGVDSKHHLDSEGRFPLGTTLEKVGEVKSRLKEGGYELYVTTYTP